MLLNQDFTPKNHAEQITRYSIYNNLGEFLARLASVRDTPITRTTPDTMRIVLRHDYDSEKNRGWFGPNSSCDLITKLQTQTNADQKLQCAVTETKNQIAKIAQLKTPARKLAPRQDTGQLSDIFGAMRGEENIYTRIKKTQAPKHRVTICVNTVVSAYHTAENVINRGAAAVAFAEILQRQNIATRIVAVSLSRDIEYLDSNPGNPVNSSCEILVLKNFQDTANISVITTALADISFFRAGLLTTLGLNTIGTITNGIGRVATLTEKPEFYNYLNSKFAIDFLFDSDILDKHSAERTVAKYAKLVTERKS